MQFYLANLANSDTFPDCCFLRKVVGLDRRLNRASALKQLPAVTGNEATES